MTAFKYTANFRASAFAACHSLQSNEGIILVRFFLVAVNGAGPCVFRLAALEQALAADFSAAALAGFRADPQGLNSDLHATAAYRAQLIGVAARRALAMALRPPVGTATPLAA